MEYLLTILGSLASVGSIPLAIYLYLRSREAKYSGLRREIAKILSFQIGEGRALSTFEIQAVIDSKIRENRLKTNSIAVNEIIEDLVSDTISSPLLNSERKADIVENLRRIYTKGKILQAIDKYHLSYHEFLLSIRQQTELLPEDSKLISKETPNIEDSEVLKDKVGVSITASSIFGILGFVGTLVGASLSLSSILSNDNISNFISGRELFINLVIGVAASFLAAIMTYLFKRKLDKYSERDRE
jgi:hypothetical protein